jgi:hypothetical protein
VLVLVLVFVVGTRDRAGGGFRGRGLVIVLVVVFVAGTRDRAGGGFRGRDW